jgi:hypothetical protein
MRFSRMLMALVTVAIVAVVVAGSATTSPTKRAAINVTPGSYSGTTSQGQGISFNVNANNPDFIDSWSIGFNLTCKKTKRTPGVGHGFGGFHVDIDPNTKTFAFKYDGAFFFFFKWDGKFTTDTTANGTALVTWGGVYKEKKAEPCTSGTVTWSASHTAQPAPLNPDKYDVVFTVKKTASGYKVTQNK